MPISPKRPTLVSARATFNIFTNKRGASPKTSCPRRREMGKKLKQTRKNAAPSIVPPRKTGQMNGYKQKYKSSHTLPHRKRRHAERGIIVQYSIHSKGRTATLQLDVMAYASGNIKKINSVHLYANSPPKIRESVSQFQYTNGTNHQPYRTNGSKNLKLRPKGISSTKPSASCCWHRRARHKHTCQRIR